MSRHLRGLVAPALLIAAFVFPPVMTEAQGGKPRARRSGRPVAQGPSLEGVVIRNNVAALKPGYELIQQSVNVVAVKRKKKKKVTGTLKCGCLGEGRCSLSVSGNRADCSGNCEDCTLLVTVGATAPSEPR